MKLKSKESKNTKNTSQYQNKNRNLKHDYLERTILLTLIQITSYASQKLN